MIDENISWRKILVGLAIMGGVNYGYNKLHPKRLTNTEMVSLLNDIKSAPNASQNFYVSDIKRRLISDINSETNLDKSKKENVTKAITDIKFVFVDSESMSLLMDGDDNVLSWII